MSAKGKQNVHNEWFMTTVQPKCDCGANRKSHLAAGQDTQVYIWGEYVCGKWRSLKKVCQTCWISVIADLQRHAQPCGCTFALCPRSGYSLAPWIKLPDDFHQCQMKEAV